MERVGSRASVMYGLAKMTGGGLTKDDLMYNEKGKIVSKKKRMMARKNMRGGSGSTTKNFSKNPRGSINYKSVQSLINDTNFDNDWLSLIHDTTIIYLPEKKKINSKSKEIKNKIKELKELEAFFDFLKSNPNFKIDETKKKNYEKKLEELKKIEDLKKKNTVNSIKNSSKSIILTENGIINKKRTNNKIIPNTNRKKIQQQLFRKILDVFKLLAVILDEKRNRYLKSNIKTLPDYKNKFKRIDKEEGRKFIKKIQNSIKVPITIFIDSNSNVTILDQGQSIQSESRDLPIKFFNFLDINDMKLDNLTIKYEYKEVKVNTIDEARIKIRHEELKKAEEEEEVAEEEEEEREEAEEEEEAEDEEEAEEEEEANETPSVMDVFKLMRGDYNTRSGGTFTIEQFIEYIQTFELKNGKYILKSTGGGSIYFDYNTKYGWHWLIKNKEEAIYYIQAQINDAKPIITNKNPLIKIN